MVATSVPRADWGAEPLATMEHLDPARRERLTAHWLGEAAAEHASVASFARFSLQLLALGAPAELVRASHEAALDEIRHAQDCYALAARFSGGDLGPGPLPIPTAPLAVDVRTVARETLRDGCLGETLAARQAAAGAAAAVDGQVIEVLERIAVDEARHAELAWRSMAWLLREHGAEARSALLELLADLEASGAHEVEPAAEAGDPTHGVLGTAQRASIARTTVREVVLPCVHTLLRHSDSSAANVRMAPDTAIRA